VPAWWAGAVLGALRNWYHLHVPTFIPLMKPRRLPSIGQTIERPVMDWKAKPATFSFESAKDIAAFANHLGGTLLIGAHEEQGQLKAYVGMTPEDAAACRDYYSKAVSDRCQPRPAIDFEEYAHPSDLAKRIVAVNVQPSLNLVGVKVAAHKQSEGWGGDSYVFPVRSGTDARYLEPGQLPMFMTPQIRRNAVMLARIPSNADVAICPDSKSYMDCTFIDMSEEDNVFTVITNANVTVRYPLDMIQSVFQNAEGKWCIMSTYYF
jgi:hypothetical protein